MDGRGTIATIEVRLLSAKSESADRAARHGLIRMALAQPILIGTAGWSYPGQPPKGWYGAFYPDAKPKGFDELKYYSSIFNTVEINSTFYRPASQATTKRWAAKTPDDFSFAIKLWQKFTHPKRLGQKDRDEAWGNIPREDIDKFRASLEPLADARKLGVLLVQYPAGFHCTPENIESDEKYASRVCRLPKGHRASPQKLERKSLRNQ